MQELKDYLSFQANDFEYLRGRILILLPENDIFKKEDQKRFANLFRKLDAEIRTVLGVMWASLFRRNGILI